MTMHAEWKQLKFNIGFENEGIFYIKHEQKHSFVELALIYNLWNICFHYTTQAIILHRHLHFILNWMETTTLLLLLGNNNKVVVSF